jgi:dUTP pyrophosphatase
MLFTKISNLAILPNRKHDTDAGLDLYSSEDVLIPAKSIKIIKTGIKCKLPENTVGLIKLKSKSNFIILGGVVDEGYTGELLVKIFNFMEVALHIDRGTAIAQLLVVPIIRPDVEEITLEDFDKINTSRGSTGGIVTQLSMFEFINE